MMLLTNLMLVLSIHICTQHTTVVSALSNDDIMAAINAMEIKLSHLIERINDDLKEGLVQCREGSPFHTTVPTSQPICNSIPLPRTYCPSDGVPTGRSLYDAAKSGDLANVCVALLSAPVDWTNPDQECIKIGERSRQFCAVGGLTALHIAAMYNHTAVIEALSEAGADFNARDDRYDFTPLHWASAVGNLNTVSMLIRLGAGVNIETKHGGVPLHYAAGYNHPAVVRVLIDAGANVDAQDEIGGTPLHDAAGTNNQAMARLLLELGANKTLRNDYKIEPTDNGETPADTARRYDNTELADIIDSYTSN